MRVAQVMTPNVRTCRPEDSLERAAQLMWDGDCGCVPVCAGDGIPRTIGVITDRDICMCALFCGQSLRELTVGEVIRQQQLRSCEMDDSLADAEEIMRQARVRRLPVTDTQGVLVGMVSLADLAREADRQQPLSDREITETEVNGTLVAICTPPPADVLTDVSPDAGTHNPYPCITQESGGRHVYAGQSCGRGHTDGKP